MVVSDHVRSSPEITPESLRVRGRQQPGLRRKWRDETVRLQESEFFVQIKGHNEMEYEGFP